MDFSFPGHIYLTGAVTGMLRAVAGEHSDAALAVSDYIGAPALLCNFPNVEWLLGDRGYDADWFREALQYKRIRACIPGRKQSKTPVKYAKCRNRIEVMFGRVKDWRRAATRFGRCPNDILSSIALAAIVIYWLCALILDCVDKEGSHCFPGIIQAGICNSDQLGTNPISDERCALFERFSRVARASTNRKPTDHRLAVDGVLWIARMGAPWRDLPEESRKWASANRQFWYRTQAGLWEGITETQTASLQMIDSTVLHAHPQAAGAKGGLRDSGFGRPAVVSRPGSAS